MLVRRILIGAPLVLIIFLLQSFFWVPTYEQQTKGNPERLTEYITASIGDASILNPVLSSDSASNDIESKVFEGLIDRDQDLRFRGRLAKAWQIYEEAYFYINEKALIPQVGKAGAPEVVRLLKRARGGYVPVSDRLKTSLDNIREIVTIPAREFLATVRGKGAEKGGEKTATRIRVRAPDRIKLILNRVDPALFENLSTILGSDYFLSFPAGDYLTALEGGRAGIPLHTEYAREVLPATEHNPVIVFYLRPHVRFHDNHSFGARDVQFTYEAIMDPRNLSPRIADFEPVKEVQVIDPRTVRIIYKRLYSPALGTWGIGILPEHLLNSEALKQEALAKGKDPARFTLRDSGFNRHPIGCGPFSFSEWKSDQYIVLNRFADYWEGPPNYKRFIYRIIPDPLTQEMEFYGGTVDNYDVQPYQVARLETDQKYQHFSGLSFGYTYVGYNLRREPFQDIRVRRALGMAIDVNKIIKYVLYDQGERITGPFVKQTDYYDHRIKPLPYDPAGALRLLAEAGWRRNREGWLEKDGKRMQFTLITNSGNDLRKAVLTTAQDAWKQIGIDCRTDLLEWAVFIQERIDKADFDAVVLGWQMGIEPDLYQIWHSSQIHPYQLNFVGFQDPQADDLIIKIRQEYDHKRQVAYCHRLHELIAREQPYTFLYISKWTAVLDKRIVIQEVDAKGNVSYKRITPTKTGDYTFYFNKWIKLPEAPVFSAKD
jgi:ABC-type transport system substrate-binding protein